VQPITPRFYLLRNYSRHRSCCEDDTTPHDKTKRAFLKFTRRIKLLEGARESLRLAIDVTAGDGDLLIKRLLVVVASRRLGEEDKDVVLASNVLEI
jgi:hypothetical protein